MDMELDHPSSTQALFALIVMVIILVFILVYCCWGAFTCSNPDANGRRMHHQYITDSPTTPSCFGSQSLDSTNPGGTVIIVPYSSMRNATIYTDSFRRHLFEGPLNIDKPPPYSEVFGFSCAPPAYRSTCNSSRCSSINNGLDLPPAYEEINKAGDAGKLQTPAFSNMITQYLTPQPPTTTNELHTPGFSTIITQHLTSQPITTIPHELHTPSLSTMIPQHLNPQPLTNSSEPDNHFQNSGISRSSHSPSLIRNAAQVTTSNQGMVISKNPPSKQPTISSPPPNLPQSVRSIRTGFLPMSTSLSGTSQTHNKIIQAIALLKLKETNGGTISIRQSPSENSLNKSTGNEKPQKPEHRNEEKAYEDDEKDVEGKTDNRETPTRTQEENTTCHINENVENQNQTKPNDNTEFHDNGIHTEIQPQKDLNYDNNHTDCETCSLYMPNQDEIGLQLHRNLSSSDISHQNYTNIAAPENFEGDNCLLQCDSNFLCSSVDHIQNSDNLNSISQIQNSQNENTNSQIQNSQNQNSDSQIQNSQTPPQNSNSQTQNSQNENNNSQIQNSENQNSGSQIQNSETQTQNNNSQIQNLQNLNSDSKIQNSENQNSTFKIKNSETQTSGFQIQNTESKNGNVQNDSRNTQLNNQEEAVTKSTSVLIYFSPDDHTADQTSADHTDNQTDNIVNNYQYHRSTE